MSSNAVARVAQPIAADDLAARCGLGGGELASVAETIRGLYRWTPALTAEGQPGHAGLTAIDAHWPQHNVSGVLFLNQEGTSGFLIHDLANNAGAVEVNSYLSHVLTTVPALAPGVTLAERSVTDPSEEFCNVIRTSPAQSQLPAQSERTMSAGDVAERVGIDEANVLRIIDDLRTPSQMPGCFAHARPLSVATMEVTGQPVRERIVA